MTTSGDVSYSVMIQADAARLWEVLRRFGDVATWNPIAVDSRLVEGPEGEIGAERELTTADGQIVRERLTMLDEGHRRLGYEMVTFPIPVTRQENAILLVEEPGKGTWVTFSSNFSPCSGREAGEIAAMNRAAFVNAAIGLARLVGSPRPIQR